jgi:hypothetical protein
MLGPHLVRGGLAFWMQTSGAVLLVVRRCSVTRAWTSAHDGCSAHGLLYLTAVRHDGREQERCQGCVDIGYASLAAPKAIGA